MTTKLRRRVGSLIKQFAPDKMKSMHAETKAIETALAKLVGIGIPALPQLVKALENPEPQVREFSMKAIVQIGPGAIPLLVIASRSTTTQFARHLAFDAMAHLNFEQVDLQRDWEQIIRCLSHGEYEIREWATRTINRIGLIALPMLVQLIDSHDWHVDEAICEFGQSAAPALIEKMRSYPFGMKFIQHPRTIMHRFICMFSLIGKAGIPALIEAIDDSSDNVRLMAELSLIDLRHLSIQPLVTLIKSKGSPVRAKAINILAAIDAETASEVVSLVEVAEKAVEQVQANQAKSELTGLALMGGDALLLRDELEKFRWIGEQCKLLENDMFSFSKMERLLGDANDTLSHAMTSISNLFERYFKDYEGVELGLDKVETADERRKIFDRSQGKKPTICRPWGWRAWELTCQFLDRQKEIDAAIKQAKRRKG